MPANKLIQKKERQMKATKYFDSKKQQLDPHEFQDWLKARLDRVNELGSIQQGILEDIKDESYSLKLAAKHLNYIIECIESEPSREQQLPNNF